jgi:elongation factor Ts
MMRSSAARTLYIRARAAVQARSGLVGSASESCRIFAAPTNYQLIFPTGTSSCSIRTFADFSMAQLKELRAMSGAPIVDCKKALGETSGNLEEAMDWLRQHGAAKAAMKVSGRDAEEGLVACNVSDDGKSASLVKVSSETDFAGKSQAFVDLVHHVANATLSSGTAGSLDSEKVMTLESSSKSVKTALEEAIVAIRENLGVASAIKLTSDDGILVAYVHGKVNEDSYAGSSAAVVELVGPGVDHKVILDAGKKLAMHIVAAKPTYLKSDDIPSEVLDRERAILQGQVNAEQRSKSDLVYGCRSRS